MWIWSGTLSSGIGSFSRILSSGQKLFYIKKEKNYLSDLFHYARKSFSANESHPFFSYVKDLKPVAVTYAFLHQIFLRLTSVFEELFIWEMRRDKKRERMIKQRRKTFFSFLHRTVIGTCYCKWNSSIWHLSRQRKQGSIFCIYLPFYKHPVYKQTVLAC